MGKNNYSIIQNSIHILSSWFISPAFSLILIIFITRYLGKEEMGKYSFVLSYFTLFSVIAGLGIDSLITRKVAADKKRTNLYLNHSIILGLSVSIMISVFMILGGFFLGYPADILIGIIVLASVIGCNTVFSYFNAVFSAYEKFNYSNYFAIALTVIRVIAGLVLLFLKYHYLAQLIVFAITQIVGVIAASVIIHRKISPLRLEFDWEIMKGDFRLIYRFGGAILLCALTLEFDVILLSKLKGMEEVAIYSAAYKMFEIAAGLPLSIILASYPILAGLYNVSREQMAALFKEVFYFLIFVVTSAILSIIFISSRVVILLYGNKFIASSEVLIILAIGLIPFILYSAFAYLFKVNHLEIYDLYANILGFIINVALNILLIPLWGSKGAALTSLITFSFMLIYGLLVSKNKLALHLLGKFSQYRRPLFAAFLVGLCSFIFSFSPLFLQLSACAVIFTVLAVYYVKLPQTLSLSLAEDRKIK
jgi:O-antigen/teichoic acid export membrane protein